MIFVIAFYSGYLYQIGDCTPPSRNGLAHATRNPQIAEDLFLSVLDDIKEKYPEFITKGRRYPSTPW